jgi:hypothetical protein
LLQEITAKKAKKVVQAKKESGKLKLNNNPFLYSKF